MKIFRTLLAAAGLLFAMTLMAQDKKSFTLDDLMWGGVNYWNLQPKNIYTAWWGDRLLQTDADDVQTFYNEKGKAEKPAVLFTEADVNACLNHEQQGKVYNLMNARFPYADSTLAFLQTGKVNLLYNWKEKKIAWSAPRTAGSSHHDFCFASRQEAYVKDWNLYITTQDGRTLQVSKDGSRELQYGCSVHRDEFGIYKGTFWSPDGKKLAFYRMDQSMVTDFPLVNNEGRIATLAPEKYPMAGMTSHKVTIGIYDTETGTTVYLKAGNPTDRYFTNIAWAPDAKKIYVIELPRTQDKAELVAYDTESGDRLNVLYSESNKRYVEPMNPITFLPWDASKFIYQSRRDGYNHLYLFDTNGKELQQLTQGNFEVITMIGFNEKTKSVIFQANADSPICHNLYSVEVKTGKRTRLDNGEGVHNAKLSATGRYLCDTWRAPELYRQIDLVNTTTTAKVTLNKADTPWSDFNVPQISCGTIKAADDSTDLYFRMVKPLDFDPNKKYPAVVYVYGGPHAHLVNASWNYSARPWEIYMAQKGYLIFVVDNRGSQYRGAEFESCIHRQLGVLEMQDQMKGVEYLKSLPYVDSERLGVHGWSFGGFMTTNLMCSYPEVFKVGVAGGPVIDWKLYEVMYGERYMDTPEENPEGYKNSNLLEKAGNLKGRLQIIVGYNDPTCVLQHSLSFLRAAADAGTQPDYFVYPGQGHNMVGKDMVHLHERITRYFDDYLK